MRRVLVIAYRYPDLIVAGGATRVEKFVKYLPGHGWRPVVLSVRMPREAALEEIHEGPWVVRTPGLYSAFVRAYRTRYLADERSWRARGIEVLRRIKNLFLVPDDAVLWWPRALPEALRLVRWHKPEAIFVSGPPFSCLLLAGLVSRLTGLPLVTDLRDDWAGNPLIGKRNPVQSLAERPLERLALAPAHRVLCVTQASLDLYRERYPRRADGMRLLPNGYDEEDFAGVGARRKEPGALRLLHVGSLRGNRSPQPLFDALRTLAARDVRYRGIRLEFVGTHHHEHVAAATAAGLNGQVDWTERLPRAEVMSRMDSCDALVLLPSQAAPTAIPGKTYEYLRAARPLLVVSEENETTRLLDGFEGPVRRRPEDTDGIAAVLAEWFHATDPPVADPALVRPFARDRLTGELGALLEEVACGS